MFDCVVSLEQIAWCESLRAQSSSLSSAVETIAACPIMAAPCCGRTHQIPDGVKRVAQVRLISELSVYISRVVQCMLASAEDSSLHQSEAHSDSKYHHSTGHGKSDLDKTADRRPKGLKDGHGTRAGNDGNASASQNAAGSVWTSQVEAEQTLEDTFDQYFRDMLM
jgi:hypothetical protein